MTENKNNPLVTFALFAYNQEKYIREAVEAALAQDYTNLEIIISDDGSVDRTFEIIREVVSNYRGEHRVFVNRNENNLGLAAHFNKILGLASGDIVAVAAGDDISLPKRVSEATHILGCQPSVYFVSFVDEVINANGQRIHKNRRRTRVCKAVDLNQFIQGKIRFPLSGASRVYRKSAFTFFGEISEKCPTEDTVMLVRCLLLGVGVVLPQPGILYRRHDTNLSGAERLHAMNFEEIRAQYFNDVAAYVERTSDSNEERQDKRRSVCEWAEKNFTRRILSARIYREPVHFELLKTLVLGREFSLQEKSSMLFRWALSGGRRA